MVPTIAGFIIINLCFSKNRITFKPCFTINLMPRISKQKRDKIIEQIIFYLFQIFPKQVFTSDVAKELARDEEFIKEIMVDLSKKDLVVRIDKNSDGLQYKKRLRWRISNKAYDIYKQQQSVSTQQSMFSDSIS